MESHIVNCVSTMCYSGGIEQITKPSRKIDRIKCKLGALKQIGFGAQAHKAGPNGRECRLDKGIMNKSQGDLFRPPRRQRPQRG